MKGGYCVCVYVCVYFGKVDGVIERVQPTTASVKTATAFTPTITNSSLHHLDLIWVLFDGIGPCCHQLCLHALPNAHNVGYKKG